MTAAVLSWGASIATPAFLERGLSADAKAASWESTDRPRSILVDEQKHVAVQALSEAYSAARVDNWDSLGSAGVEQSTFEYALTFLRMLPTNIPLPEVAIDPDGEIAFEWDYSRNEILSVSIGRDGTLTFASLFGGRKSHGVEQLSDRIPPTVALSLEDVARVRR